jgi:nitrogen fixation/metabolism regulation signal transduction histidine kinase
METETIGTMITVITTIGIFGGIWTGIAWATSIKAKVKELDAALDRMDEMESRRRYLLMEKDALSTQFDARLDQARKQYKEMQEEMQYNKEHREEILAHLKGELDND